MSFIYSHKFAQISAVPDRVGHHSQFAAIQVHPVEIVSHRKKDQRRSRKGLCSWSSYYGFRCCRWVDFSLSRCLDCGWSRYHSCGCLGRCWLARVGQCSGWFGCESGRRRGGRAAAVNVAAMACASATLVAMWSGVTDDNRFGDSAGISAVIVAAIASARPVAKVSGEIVGVDFAGGESTLHAELPKKSANRSQYQRRLIFPSLSLQRQPQPPQQRRSDRPNANCSASRHAPPGSPIASACLIMQ